MNSQIESVVRKVRTALRFASHLRRNVRGNAMIIMAVALIPLMFVAGSAIDTARLYFVKSRLQQACDAGALAGRKFMAGTSFDSVAQQRARDFFNNNFRDGIFGSTGTSFVPTGTPDNQVHGDAATTVPMTLSSLMGMQPQRLTVSCDARLEIPNVDAMFVLDTTGSMGDPPPGGGASSKIQALRDAVMNFYDTVESTRQTGTRVRYGFVPYSTNVNVGMLLRREWLRDSWTYQSRVFDSQSTSTSTSTTTTTYGPSTYTGSKVTSTVSSGAAESCTAPANQGYSNPYTTGTISNDGTTRYWWEKWVANGTTYSASFSNGICTISKTVYNNYTQYRENVTKPCTSNCSSNNVTNYWWYQPVQFDVSGFKGNDPSGVVTGGTVAYPIGNANNAGATWTNVTWGGTKACIEERQTVRQLTYPSIPSAAYDMDFDMVPDPTRPETQWAPALPQVIYARSGVGSWTYGAVRSSSNLQRMDQYYGGAYTACPSPSRKLNSITRGSLQSYVNGLVPVGNTYHDIGFLWGVRLISPTGIFASENQTAPNGGSISRHIIFMTDGGTDTSSTNYEAYGISALDRRRTSTGSVPSKSDEDTIVANRLAVMCTAAKQKNITIWVIAFGTSLTPLLQNCASDGRAYQANDASQLNNAFKNIASQIAKLRISK